MDLVIAACLLLFLGTASFRGCRRFGCRYPTLSNLGIVVCLGLATWLSWTTSYDLKWAAWLPHGSVLFFANTSLLLMVSAAGLFFGAPKIETPRKYAVGAVLCTTCVLGIISVALRPVVQPLVIQSEATWKDEVCLQTHEASCAPAAAATLLNLHGVEADESKMARRCLTSSHGTLSLAAFRGISVESRTKGMTTKALVCEPHALPTNRLVEHFPMLALVDFEVQLSAARNGQSASVYRGRAPRAPNRRAKPSDERHAVVLLERLPDGQFLVADPAIGKVRWEENYFRNIWVGEGIYIDSQQ